MNLIDWVIQIRTNSFSSQASLILYSRTLGTEQEQRLPSKIPQDRWVSQVDHPVFWGCCRWCSHVAEGAPWHLMSLHPLFGLTASATATLGIGMSEVTLERTGNILTSKNRGKSGSSSWLTGYNINKLLTIFPTSLILIVTLLYQV